MNASDAYEAALTLHYETQWKANATKRRWFKGPVRELPPSFCVLEVAPSEKREMWTYATCCMSQPNDQRRVELHMFAPQRSEELVELLTMVAHFHRTGVALDLGHTVNFGRGWLATSKCDHGLVSLPYLDGPGLEDADVGGLVKCFWLVPVTKEEVEYKKRLGLDALEERFEASGLNYLDVKRTSVV